MQLLEASLSFMVLVSCSSMLLLEEPDHIDDSLHRLQLAEDIWRVLYLRGALDGMERDRLEPELAAIGQETGSCIFIEGVQYTNCRGPGEPHMLTASMQKTVLVNGTPQRVSFSFGR
jgi:hypothetical protein